MEQQPSDHSVKERWLEHFMAETFAEQKRTRRWGVFFKLLVFVYLFVTIMVFYSGFSGAGFVEKAEPHTAMVRVDGLIAEGEVASANVIVSGLRKAFEAEHSKAIMLVINSPGGSPVQAGYVYDEVQRLKALHSDKTVYAVIADLGASGGYYIAAAADQIYANRASLVGSIGVTASGFGFVDAIEKLGVERRHFTSGENKAFLDPFSPLKEDQAAYWQDVLAGVHQQFINVVKEGRGDRLVLDENLAATEEALFSGLIWNGEQALKLGLIDGLSSPGRVARDVVKAEDIVDYTPRQSPLELFSQRLGASIGSAMAERMGVSSQPALQ